MKCQQCSATTHKQAAEKAAVETDPSCLVSLVLDACCRRLILIAAVCVCRECVLKNILYHDIYVETPKKCFCLLHLFIVFKNWLAEREIFFMHVRCMHRFVKII